MTVKICIDITVAFCIAIVAMIPMLIIALVIKFTSKGPIIYWSQRVGQYNKIFYMPKFRTMYLGAPTVATHLIESPIKHITPIGKILRNFSLDELPQLWSIICGKMSIIGPRPALFNQDDLIKLRTDKNIHLLKPGITGWAQINGRDELTINEKVKYDTYYFEHQSFILDLKIFFLTFKKILLRDNIKH